MNITSLIIRKAEILHIIKGEVLIIIERQILLCIEISVEAISFIMFTNGSIRSQYIKVSVLGVLNSDPIKLPLFLKIKKSK